MQYNPAFDGLRALSVLAVVAFHCKLPFVMGGFVGVDVFFVLSGFLITTILRDELIRTGRISLTRFYLNRALRLYPPLLIMLTVWAILIPFVHPGIDVLRNAAIAALYLSDYVMAFGSLRGNLGHTWSLAVEEHFYMLWPLLIIALGKLTGWRFTRALVFAFVAATLWRMLDLMLWLDWSFTYQRFDTAMAGLILGGVAAVIPWRPSRKIAGPMGLAGIVFLAFAAFNFRWGQASVLLYGVTLVHFMTACLLLSLVSGQTLLFRALSWPPLVYLGLLSYSIYLWHFPLAAVLRKVFDPVDTFTIVAPISIAVAAVSYELVEKPLRALRNKRALATTEASATSNSAR